MKDQIYVVVPFSRPHMIDNVLSNFKRQNFYNKKLIIVENGKGLGTCKRRNIEPDLLLQSEAHQSHAKNTALDEIRATGGGLWTTFDDDDYYGPNYLCEVVDNIGNGDIVGKADLFVNLSDGRLVSFCSGEENKLTTSVNGPTISAWAEDSLEFNSQVLWEEDMLWIKEMKKFGAKVYATSRFNFVFQRRNISDHTWKANDSQIIQMMYVTRNDKGALKVKDFGTEWSYDIINGTSEEPEFSLIAPMPFDMERDNPAAIALKNLPAKIERAYIDERKKLIDSAIKDYEKRLFA